MPAFLALILLRGLAASPARADLSEAEFLSVSTETAVVREEPREKAQALWTMWKFAPVEVVSYREDWVHIRDFEGDEGWLKRAELFGQPAVCVSVKEGKVRAKPGAKAKVEWLLDKGYPLRVFSSRDGWYEVSDLEDVSGWIHRGSVWGFPVSEKPAQ